MRAQFAVYAVLAILALAAPFLGLYPVFLMKLLCFAMFACAFNLLLGYTKMLSFGHAAYFGSSAYVTGGENGLQGIPRGRIFGMFDLSRDRTMYYFVLAAFVAVYALIRRLVHSP